MTPRSIRLLAGAVLACLALVACDKSKGGDVPSYDQKDGPDNLKGLLDTIVKANEAGDLKKAAALTRGLIPDKAALAKAFKDDAPAPLVESMSSMREKIPTDDAQVAGLIKRGDAKRTEIKVHGATTEEIAEYKDGSVAFNEFPGGARRLAESALRPGTKFYEVEFLEPGNDAGMKYHLFYFDGSAWRMLGPAWRSLK
jgi:hypothetical protein